MTEQPTEAQIKEMQEKMKNMSPEEIKELQKQQCVFCQIIEDKVASKKIYEDDKCLAILDINPANPGHLLLMPKEHHPLMPLIPEDILGHMSMVSKALSQAMLTSIGAEGTDIFIANGSAAGQRAQHFMIHIIPRKPADGVPLDIPVNKFKKKEIDDIKDLIIEKVNALFKLNKEVVKEQPKVSKKVENKETKQPKKKAATKTKKKEVGLDDIANLFK